MLTFIPRSHNEPPKHPFDFFQQLEHGDIDVLDAYAYAPEVCNNFKLAHYDRLRYHQEGGR